MNRKNRWLTRLYLMRLEDRAQPSTIFADGVDFDDFHEILEQPEQHDFERTIKRLKIAGTQNVLSPRAQTEGLLTAPTSTTRTTLATTQSKQPGQNAAGPAVYVPATRITEDQRAFLNLRPCFGDISSEEVTHNIPLPPPSDDGPNGGSVRDSYGKLPLDFEANHGQTDPRVLFTARAPGYTLFLTATEAVMALANSKEISSPAQPDGPTDFRNRMTPPESTAWERSVVRMQWTGGNPNASVAGEKRLSGLSNYFRGNDPNKWVTDVPHYGGVIYDEVYPGIDLRFYDSGERQLEYDWLVAPGADPRQIQMKFQGVDEISLDGEGNLVLHTNGGELRQQAPVLYQNVDGHRQAVTGRFEFQSSGEVGFAVGAYDSARPLVIDPVVVAYSTFIGGSDNEDSGGMTTDAAGNVYVTGISDSVDLPITSGAFDDTFDGAQDAFVTKLNAAGTALVYSTYLGGVGQSLAAPEEFGLGIAVNSVGNAYITGYTHSPDFPTTLGAFDTTYNGTAGANAFVTKLNATGSALHYSTFLGGATNSGAAGNKIAVAPSGSAYVTGLTASPDFPTTAGAYDTTFNGGFDGYVTKLNALGSALVYSTFLGGSGSQEFTSGIVVDACGNTYVTGVTTSSDFPTTTGAFETTYNGGQYDAFVTKLNSNGSALHYSTFLGGSDTDFGRAIALDTSGNAYVTGTTGSADYPATAGAFDITYNGGLRDSYVTKLNTTGSALVYSTFLGGSNLDGSTGIKVDASGSAYLAGGTDSPDFPTTPDAFDPFNFSYDRDAHVTKLNATGSALEYSTFLGGSGVDVDHNYTEIALSGGNVYVFGDTHSGDFPTTPGAYDTTLNTEEVFVVKFSGL